MSRWEKFLAALRKGVRSDQWALYYTSRKAMTVRIYQLREKGYVIESLYVDTLADNKPIYLYTLVYEPETQVTIKTKLLDDLQHGVASTAWAKYCKTRTAFGVKIHKLRSEGYKIRSVPTSRPTKAMPNPIVRYFLVSEPKELT